MFTVSVPNYHGPFQPVGAMSLAMPDPVYVGLGVCTDDAKVSGNRPFLQCGAEEPLAKPRERQRVRKTSLETLSHREAASGNSSFASEKISRRPTGRADGKLFYINREWGRCARFPSKGVNRRLWTPAAIRGCYNDHGLSFDGQWLAISAAGAAFQGGSKVYVLPASGGTRG